MTKNSDKEKAQHTNKTVPFLSQNQLKNKRELDICALYTLSKTPLAIGIEKKNKLKPLLKELNISNLSQLKYADLNNITFEPNSFNTVIALNTLEHCSNWQKHLNQWQTLLQSNGRIIFNLLSLEHQYVFQTSASVDSISNDSPTYISLDDLLSFTNQHNLKIIDIIPYGEIYNNDSQWIIHSDINHSEWKRLLSRADHDHTFFDFLNFLDTSLFSKLSTAAARHYMVVLEKSSITVDNNHWKNSQIEINTMIMNGVSASSINHFLESNIDLFLNNLSSYLESPYALALIFKLWSLVDFNTQRLDLQSFLIPEHYAILDHWAQQHARDTICLNFVENWHRLPIFSESLSFHNVPLGAG